MLDIAVYHFRTLSKSAGAEYILVVFGIEDCKELCNAE